MHLTQPRHKALIKTPQAKTSVCGPRQSRFARLRAPFWAGGDRQVN